MTTDATVRPRLMPGVIKGGLIAALVFVASWGAAISYWRTTGRMPETWELALYLLGLPLFALLAFWAGSKWIAQRAAGPAWVPASIPTKRSTATTQAAPLAIMAASLRTPHGASPEELAAAIAANKARPDLDPELLDDDGFPVMTARSGEARDDALREQVMEWLAASGMPDPHFSDEQWRAVTLASAVVAELAGHAMGDLIPADATPLSLQLVPVLPAHWNVDQRRAVGLWLKHAVIEFGWPADHINVAGEAQADAHLATAPDLLGRLAHDAAAANAPVAAIVVACASSIGESTVEQWAANRTLFTASHTNGDIPGEGAAGILLTDLATARSNKGTAFAMLDAMEEARRDSPADQAKRLDSGLLDEVAERALKRSGASFADVAVIVADTGHRSNRTLELMAHASGKMPQLDGTDDVLRVGAACGTCGDVPFITALALAGHYTLERQAPALFISNEDPYHRVAALVRPPSPLI